MKIPAKVRVGAQWYAVEQQDRRVGESEAYGEMIRATLAIHLRYDLAQSLKEQVFIHEIIEAMNAEYDLKMEHHTIEQLESALYQVITDNPEMFQGAE